MLPTKKMASTPALKTSNGNKAAMVVGIIAILILIIGGINWGVVGIRQIVEDNGIEIPDMIEWTTYWGQVTVYFLVFAAALVTLILLILGLATGSNLR